MNSYNENNMLGLGQKERQQLTALLSNSKVIVSAEEASKIWNIDNDATYKLLYRLSKKGWLKRIKQGIYLPIPLTSSPDDILVEEPFVIAERIFNPCYITGMNAANYWGLTEQIFITTTVMTQKMVRNRTQVIADNEYKIHTIKSKYFFGLKSIWFDDVKVNIADPSRLILDMLVFPDFCGGIRFCIEVFKNYIKSDKKDLILLQEYILKLKNYAAIKRLGFITEKYFKEEESLIKFCYDCINNDNTKKGIIKIDPLLNCNVEIKKWRLLIPKSLDI
tara:strand:+ start:13941 stop:14771 length:831 start_codon:yes stop_codon:yes gene_type:complete